MCDIIYTCTYDIDIVVWMGPVWVYQSSFLSTTSLSRLRAPIDYSGGELNHSTLLARYWNQCVQIQALNFEICTQLIIRFPLTGLQVRRQWDAVTISQVLLGVESCVFLGHKGCVPAVGLLPYVEWHPLFILSILPCLPPKPAHFI